MNKMNFREIDVEAVLHVREKSIIVVIDEEEVVIPRSNLSWRTDTSVEETPDPTTLHVATWWLNNKGL